MIAAYLRVSSGSQDVATQRKAIETASRARKDKIGRWFSDVRTGKKLARPELDKVRALVRAGELRKLYVFRLDRLTRSGIRDTLQVVEELRRGGCELVTLSDGFSLDGPAADVVIAVLAWAADMERRAIVERLTAARARIEREGGHWGRPRAIGPKQEREIRTLWKQNKLSADPLSLRELAERLKLSEPTVRRVVRQKGPYGRASKAAKKRG